MKRIKLIFFLSVLSMLLVSVLSMGLINNTLVLGDVQSTNSDLLHSYSESSGPVPFRYSFRCVRIHEFCGWWTDPAPKVYTSLVVDSKNNPHLFACVREWQYEVGSGYRDRGYILHEYYNGSNWVSEKVDWAYYPYAGREYISADLDSRDYPHIVYTRQDQLRYLFFNGSSWIGQNIAAQGKLASICLDSKDNPHVSYFDDSGLKYAYLSGGFWNNQTVDNDANCTEWQAPISLDSNDNPHIAYFAGPAPEKGSLKHAYYEDVSWNIETVDMKGDGVSLVLDSYNNPHISYRNGTIVKYAHLNGTSWLIEEVDNTLQYSGDTHIALNSQLIPYIAYVEYVKVASWYDTDWFVKLAYRYDEHWAIQNATYSGMLRSIFPYGIPKDQLFIDIDSNDNLHLSFWLKDANGGQYGCYLFGTKQFLTDFTFNDKSGVPLYRQPEHIEALAPDGTLVTFMSHLNQWLDKGTWTLKKVVWQGTDITPPGNITYNSTSIGTWTINTRVYALKIKLKDQNGNYVNRGLNLTFPNGTSLVKNPTSGWINMTQIQNGTITIKTPIWVYPSERYTLLNSTSISLTENTVIDSLVWLYETTTLTISCSPSTTYVGFKVDITGKLSNSLTGGISGATIVLNYQVPGVPTWNLIQSATTKTDGTFSIIWIPTATGYYVIEASWAGNDNWPPGAKNTINLAITPYSDEYVFSVESNSTVSSLVFNSTSRELSFTLSGPTGTYGYVDIIIAKSLIANVVDIRVYLNGTQTDYTVTSADNSWRLHFTYHHSTYKLIVRLGPTPFIPLQLVTPLTIGTLTIILIIATVIAILRIRKRAPSTILDSAFR